MNEPTANHPIRCGCGRYYWPEPGDPGQCGVCTANDGIPDSED